MITDYHDYDDYQSFYDAAHRIEGCREALGTVAGELADDLEVVQLRLRHHHDYHDDLDNYHHYYFGNN